MYAPQPPRRSSSRATPKTPRSLERSRHRGRAFQQEIVQEVGAKLAVNLVLAVVALAYLGRLVSYNLAQEQKLERLQAEVAAVDNRVERLQDEFAVQFDTHQTQQLVRQQRHRVSPNQMQIIWTTPPGAIASPETTAVDEPQPNATDPSAQL